MAEYQNVQNHAQQIASGEFVAAYTPTKNLDPKDPHDAALIESGAFLPTAKAKQEQEG